MKTVLVPEKYLERALWHAEWLLIRTHNVEPNGVRLCFCNLLL